jgi:hypothetical protein
VDESDSRVSAGLVHQNPDRFGEICVIADMRLNRQFREAGVAGERLRMFPVGAHDR